MKDCFRREYCLALKNCFLSEQSEKVALLVRRLSELAGGVMKALLEQALW